MNPVAFFHGGTHLWAEEWRNFNVAGEATRDDDRKRPQDSAIHVTALHQRGVDGEDVLLSGLARIARRAYVVECVGKQVVHSVTDVHVGTVISQGSPTGTSRTAEHLIEAIQNTNCQKDKNMSTITIENETTNTEHHIAEHKHGSGSVH